MIRPASVMFCIIAVAQFCTAIDHPAACPSELKQLSLPVVELPGQFQGDSEDALFFRAFSPHPIAVEVEYDAQGRMLCASPLSGWSLYWPYAIRALSDDRNSNKVGPGKSIILFSDPLGGRHRNAAPGLISRCSSSQGPEMLLSNALVLMSRGDQYREEAGNCYRMALVAQPDSPAANYGLAIAARTLKETDSGLEHIQKVKKARPEFYEARFVEIMLHGDAGDLAGEEASLKAILQENPPLPVQQRAFDLLTRFYDRGERREDAMLARRSFMSVLRDLRNRYPALVPDFSMTFYGADLALRLEEQKQYQEAEHSYQEAMEFALKKNSKVSEAVQFELAMGRARSLQRLGETAAARSACSEWKNRIRQFRAELENFHWQGAELTQAKWELSCGDFEHGLEMMRRVARKYATAPDQRDIYRAAAPFRALETIYRAHGDWVRARLARETADRVQAQWSARALADIFRDVDPLFREK